MTLLDTIAGGSINLMGSPALVALLVVFIVIVLLLVARISKVAMVMILMPLVSTLAGAGISEYIGIPGALVWLSLGIWLAMGIMFASIYYFLAS